MIVEESKGMRPSCRHRSALSPSDAGPPLETARKGSAGENRTQRHRANPLPIRGVGTMRDTLRHYRVGDSPSFRLVQNAIDELMTVAPARTAASPQAVPITSARGSGDGRDIIALCRRQVDALPDFGAGDEGDLLRDVAGRAGSRIDPGGERLTRAMKHAGTLTALGASWNHMAATMKEHFDTASERKPAQQLMELELAVALVECWTRVAELDLALMGRA